MTSKFMQEVMNQFSPESTDEEIMQFIAVYPLGENIKGDLVLGHYFLRALGKTPYQALLASMNALEKSINEVLDNG